METELENKMSFPDLVISKCNGKLCFSIFRKDTFSGLGTSFFSYCHMKFKINVTKTLLHRAFALTSSYELFHKEVMFLKDYFIQNGYTCHLFYKIVSNFLSKMYNTGECVPTVEKVVIYLSIPYLADVSHKIELNLKRILTRFYPHVDFRFIHNNGFKIGSLFPFKDRLPADLCSSIAYCFTCPRCQAGYIGSSYRCFKTRVAEHIAYSYHSD